MNQFKKKNTMPGLRKVFFLHRPVFFLLTRSHFRTSRTKVRINDHIQLYINAISSFLSGNKTSSFKFEAYRPGDRIPIMGFNKILQI